MKIKETPFEQINRSKTTQDLPRWDIPVPLHQSCGAGASRSWTFYLEPEPVKKLRIRLRAVTVIKLLNLVFKTALFFILKFVLQQCCYPEPGQSWTGSTTLLSTVVIVMTVETAYHLLSCRAYVCYEHNCTVPSCI